MHSLTTEITSSLDYTTLDPISTSCLHTLTRWETNLEPAYLSKTSFQYKVLKTGNKDSEENFSHLNPAKRFETENENQEEDFSHLSHEEQAVLRNISRLSKEHFKNANSTIHAGQHP
jgi:hypothetical protein